MNTDSNLQATHKTPLPHAKKKTQRNARNSLRPEFIATLFIWFHRLLEPLHAIQCPRSCAVIALLTMSLCQSPMDVVAPSLALQAIIVVCASRGKEVRHRCSLSPNILVFVFIVALRQWRRGNIALITALPVLDCLYTGRSTCCASVWGEKPPPLAGSNVKAKARYLTYCLNKPSSDAGMILVLGLVVWKACLWCVW